MVTGTLWNMLADAFAFLVGLLPHPTLPDWFGVLPVWFGQALAVAGQMSGWFPVSAIGQGIAFVLLCWVASIAIKVLRIALSFFTAGGGSAA